MKHCSTKKCYILMLAFLLAAIVFWFSLPSKLFTDPTSTILYSKENKLLGARIASDGQWRFPELKQVPEKFEKSLISFEDQYFYYHPGVNPLSLLRAAVQNIKAGTITSGGSTLSMQVVRIARKGKARNIYQKIIEMLLAIRLEVSCSKKEILNLYASHAPFGGNVVGLEAAAWRFFGRSPNHLSWAEAATLAVLPNAPSLIYPGRNNEKLKVKRNRLLKKLLLNEVIDSSTYNLSKLEEIPSKIHQLPGLAPHLLDRAHLEHKGQHIQSTIDHSLQKRVNRIVKKHQLELEANQIYNMAVLVLDVDCTRTLAYVGNTSKNGTENHANQVDIIRAPRSTGSILKPFLFAAMLDEGEILPNSLVPDIPTQIAGYSPKNFSLAYDGAVAAQEALSRSLNVPFVRMLREYGVERFHYLMKELGMKTLNRPAEHYGLSLILGGAEGTLWDLCGIYAGLARRLNNYNLHGITKPDQKIHKPVYLVKDTITVVKNNSPFLLSPAALYQTFEALVEVNRPSGESSWKSFSSSQKIAWKTGTSFGFRDAWAIGLTSRYVVGVWVGNADGEGRPGLTGVRSAAPVLFDVFDLLPGEKWFEMPLGDMEQVEVCRESGYRAGKWCHTIDTLWASQKGAASQICPYHHLVHLDATKRYRVNSDCELVSNMVHQEWFVLPPAMEWYYKKQNPLYRPLPPYRDDCFGTEQNAMELIYPRGNDRIFIPVELDETRGKVVFEIAHYNPDKRVFWHLDGEFIGETTRFHQKELSPEEGDHVLTWVDEEGNTLFKKFTITGARSKETSSGNR